MRDELFEFVVSGLKDRKGEWTRISGDTGVSTRTITRIVNGENSNRRDTLLKLAEHFKTHGITQSPQQ